MEPLLVSVQVFSGSGFGLSDDFFFCFVSGTLGFLELSQTQSSGLQSFTENTLRIFKDIGKQLHLCMIGEHGS